MHMHTLGTWLLGETTPVGVLCFHNDSKDDLERVEWERGKCEKIVSNEIYQLTAYSQIMGQHIKVERQLPM